MSRATTRIVIPPRQTDPNKFSASDAELQCWGAPFANFGYSFTEFGVRWWFDYFAKEARSSEAAKLPNWKKDWTDVLNLVFIKKQEIPPGMPDVTGRGWWPALRPGVDQWKTRPETKPGEAASTAPDSNAIWREALSKLLKLGFRAVTNGEVPPDGVNLLRLDATVAPDHMLQQRILGKKVAELEDSMNTSEIPIYWRSETRDLQRILSQQGTKRQCDVESIAQEMNMTASWHPFSDPSLSKYMWFRLTHGDNDYYTVISVATSFETACGFPKIDEKRVYQFPPAQVANWSKAQAERFKSNLGLVSENGRENVRLITTTTTYMLVYTGSVLDTMGAARTINRNSFPELGVDRIPLQNIYCVVPIRRVHHGPTPENGFTVFIDSANCKRLHGAKEVDFFGISLSTHLFKIFLEKMSRRPFATAWSGAGATAPDIPANITRILEFPISEGKFQAFKARLADNETHAALPEIKSASDKMKAVMGQLPRKP